MLRLFAVTLLPGLAILANANSAFAQSLFGSGGGTTQTGGAAGGNRTTTTSGVGGLAGQAGGGAGAQNNLNTSGINAQTGMTGPQLNTELGALSQTIGQGGFVGRSDSAGTFVGNTMAGQQAIQGTNVGGFGQFGGQFGGSQFSGRNGGFNQNNFGGRGGQSRRVVRHSLRIAFDHPSFDNGTLQTKLDTQFTKLQTNRPELQDVQVQIAANQEAVLRGQVASTDDKKLAAILARLEPGVRSVRNELTVQQD